ncbi:WavE lipopolysaccharide synthesis family protein [Azospirillum palustre]
MPMLSWASMRKIVAKAVRGDIKLIGWGAAGAFDIHYAACPYKYAYLIDKNPELQGTMLNGIPILRPEMLAQEDPSKVLVVIFPHVLYAKEIGEAIDAMGSYWYCYPFEFSFVTDRLGTVARTLAEPLPAKTVTSDTAIVVQGPFQPGVTDEILGFYRRLYPGNRLILSTWVGLSPDHCALAEQLCHDVVLNEPPKSAGISNRNYQTISTCGGIDAAAAKGARYVLKARSDMLMVEKSALPVMRQFCQELPAGSGTRRRIVTTSMFSRRYLPYHFSDMFQFGEVDTVREFYDISMNVDAVSNIAIAGGSLTMAEFARRMLPPECEYGSNFARRLGYEVDFSIEQYWEIARRHFAILDASTLNMFWLKYGSGGIGCRIEDRLSCEPLDHMFWSRLSSGFNMSADLAGVDIERVKVSEMFAHPRAWVQWFSGFADEPLPQA